VRASEVRIPAAAKSPAMSSASVNGRRRITAAPVRRLLHPLLDRELDVLHVRVVALELAQDLRELVGDRRHRIAPLGDIERLRPLRPRPALRSRQEVARRLGAAGRLVATKGHPGARGFACVPVHHLLHLDSRAPVVGGTSQPARRSTSRTRRGSPP
jgi:hypothetical protein